jgi:outer membrane protein assembly factor BamB/tetratricopeptide (TPR) repeat protein
MLKGNLSSFSLGEIFQSLAVNNHTGTLKITTKDKAQKCIYFSHGEISLFSTGSAEALRVGEILIRLNRLSPDSLKVALDEQKSSGELLGQILLRKGMITKEDLRQALETKIREEIYDLFLLTDAEFEFYIDHLPEEVFDPLQKNTRLAINTSSLVLEGIRRVDEWRLIQRRIKTFDEIYVPAGAITVPEDDPLAAKLISQLDGRTPVWKLFEVYGGSRFECSKTIYEFLESGHVRPISIEEAIQGGGKSLESGDVEQAFAFFRFAEQLDPRRVEVLRPLAQCLEKLERPKEATQAECAALRIYSERGMHRQALELGRKLLAPGTEIDTEIPEMVFRASIALGEKEAAVSIGELTAKLAMERKDFLRAEQVIEQLWSLDLKDLNSRLALADQLAKMGEKERAIGHLDAVARELDAEKKIKELIKVLRVIFSIDPRRQDAKQRIQSLLTKQERMERRKKRRVTIAGGSVILLMIASMVPIIYEIKARELYCHAQRLEEISHSSNDFTKARDAYEQLLKFYCFSTRASSARESLERVAAIERARRETQEREKAAVEKIQERKLQILRDELPVLLVQVKKLEEEGKIQEAHEIASRISTEYADISGSRAIPFPILVTSSPKGALVEANGAFQGPTPILLHAQRGQELTLVFSRSGCQSAEEKVTVGQKWRVHQVLQRRPSAEMKFSGPVQQALLATGERIYFPSRDGFLYCVSPVKNEIAWQRRVGQFGDLVSEVGATPDAILLGNVSGEVLAIQRDNGKARWRGKLGAAVIATPATSPDGRWVAAASVEGETAIFDSREGTLKGTFRAEDEVVGAPLFLDGVLLVGSADRRIYELAVPGAVPRRAAELPAGVSTALIPFHGSVVFGIASGGLAAYGPSEGRVLWTCALGAEPTGPPAIDGERAYVGTAAGTVAAVDATKGTVVWRVEFGKGRVGRVVVHRDHLFAGSESGELISISLASGAREWTYKADSPIFSPPLAVEGRLYVACATGKILVMEVVE